MTRPLFALLLLAWSAPGLANSSARVAEQAVAKTFRLATASVIRQGPDGRIVDIWERDTLFTALSDQGEWLRISGHFPAGRWQPHSQGWWIRKDYAHEASPGHDAPTPAPIEGSPRFIVVDKSDFRLTVFEERAEQHAAIFNTTVALGMDRCLPKTKGGRCYYTDPGDYQVRWKVHDPSGIEWCIPKHMEKEYPRAIARGQRCFRGPLGQYALNIGKSYAIHGTNNTASLGKKASHGCIRVANNAMKTLYRLMRQGDKVYIQE